MIEPDFIWYINDHSLKFTVLLMLRIEFLIGGHSESIIIYCKMNDIAIVRFSARNKCSKPSYFVQSCKLIECMIITLLQTGYFLYLPIII